MRSDATQTSVAEPTAERARAVLEALKVDSSTGPDILPTRILKECAAELAVPLLMLAQSILRTQTWPALWLIHWIVPLFKKLSVYKASCYRGIHLTAQMSKAMERYIGELFGQYLLTSVSFGPHQFAYTKERGSRDAIAFMTLSWIYGFNEGKQFGVYCSDVSGAFDRVKRERLVAKLRAKGIHETFVRILDSWLQARRARVVVGGAQGADMELTDMIYQGTVWGPWLWNIFYEDSRLAINKALFQEIVYADDLNAFREFFLRTPNADILTATKACQKELHAWGRANQVAFDPGKESHHVVSHVAPEGPDFKILGILFDCGLTMAAALHELVGECRWKIRALQRTNRFHSVREMIDLYKAQILSFIEYRTPGIYHACDSHLRVLDQLQSKFLQDLGICEEDALLNFNLAPLASRRDIAMLGLIQRTLLGRGPPHFKRFFFLEPFPHRVRTRSASRCHSHRIHEYREGRFLEIVKRSALGLASVYNLLPEEVVSADNVPFFQGQLQDMLRDVASRDHRWAHLFSPRHFMHAHPLHGF